MATLYARVTQDAKVRNNPLVETVEAIRFPENHNLKKKSNNEKEKRNEPQLE
jgi:hypothetical protein